MVPKWLELGIEISELPCRVPLRVHEARLPFKALWGPIGISGIYIYILWGYVGLLGFMINGPYTQQFGTWEFGSSNCSIGLGKVYHYGALGPLNPKPLRFRPWGF